MMVFVGMERGSALYWVLKVAVPQIKEGRIVERGGVRVILRCVSEIVVAMF